MIGSLLFFLITSLALGFLVDILVRDWKADFIEKIVVRMGAGILMMPVIGVILNLVHIPIHWVVFFVIALLLLWGAYYLRKPQLVHDLRTFFAEIRSKSIKKYVITGIILIVFSLTAYMYVSGSFAYPWFENGDPYPYALAAKYIALEGTFSSPYYFTHFADPYPQGYNIVMGVIHQTNNSINHTLKLFNALIVSFSILFFFYFVRRFTGREKMALWSTVVLAAIPAWLSHFIFALGFNMSLMFILFYAIVMLEQSKRWKYLAALFFGSLIVTHFYTAFVIGLLLLIWYGLRLLVFADFNKNVVDSVLLGIGIGLLFWAPALWRHWDVFSSGEQLGGVYIFFPLIESIKESIPLLVLGLLALVVLSAFYIKHKLWFPVVAKKLSRPGRPAVVYLAGLTGVLLVLLIPSDYLIYARGSGSRAYSFADFFFAQQENMINNPIGIGWFVMILFLIGFVIAVLNYRRLFKRQNISLLVSVTWVLFSFVGVMGTSLSIGFVPFRMWTFFGLSLALLAGYGTHWILSAAGKVPYERAVKILFIVIAIFLLYSTSFSQKYWHNTAQWPEHQIFVPESRELYVWMKDGGLPKDSMVTNLCHRESLLLGYDMLSLPWEARELGEDGQAYFLKSMNQTLEDNYAFLKRNNFEYVTIGASCVQKMKMDPIKVGNRVQGMMDSTNFELVKATNTEALFRVV